jgi:hypothetical protein
MTQARRQFTDDFKREAVAPLVGSNHPDGPAKSVSGCDQSCWADGMVLAGTRVEPSVPLYPSARPEVGLDYRLTGPGRPVGSYPLPPVL